MTSSRCLVTLVLFATLTACGGSGDDDGGRADGAGGGNVDARDLPDGIGGVCATVDDLDPLITCTVGDDAPCAAICADAYCYEFGNLPQPVCTRDCLDAGDCPEGWSCNAMGRCRPPG